MIIIPPVHPNGGGAACRGKKKVDLGRGIWYKPFLTTYVDPSYSFFYLQERFRARGRLVMDASHVIEDDCGRTAVTERTLGDAFLSSRAGSGTARRRIV